MNKERITLDLKDFFYDEQQEILSCTEPDGCIKETKRQRGHLIVHMNDCSRMFSNRQDEFRAGGQSER